MQSNYETDQEFQEKYPRGETYRITSVFCDNDTAIGWSILGYETVPDQDTEWSGLEVPTGCIVAVMVGDDQRHIFNPEDYDIEILEDDECCSCCGQIGCQWN
tara:strand:+ start:448 stop:753 length:306 start_codon:yes stop_codon:yes gene_type:complete